MIVLLLMVHGLVAVALLGALTHQACGLIPSGPKSERSSFFARFRNVNTAVYATPVALLFAINALAGALLYPRYRVDVRPVLEDLQLRAANGVFEIKEHLVAVGLGILPGYWFFWQTPLAPEQARARRYLTWLLAFVVWWAFLVGHFLNNIKGLWS